MTVFEGIFFKKKGAGTGAWRENQVRVKITGKIQDIQLLLDFLEKSGYTYSEIVITKFKE